jgi:hypothetical protein
MKRDRSLFGMRVLRAVSTKSRAFWFAFVSPKVVVGLCDVQPHIREVTRSVARVVSTEMANEGMSHDHGVNILRVDPSLFQPVRQPSDRRSKDMQNERPTMSERYGSVLADAGWKRSGN